MPAFRLLDPPWRLPVELSAELSTLPRDVQQVRTHARIIIWLPILLLAAAGLLAFWLPQFYARLWLALMAGLMLMFFFPAWARERALARACKELLSLHYHEAMQTLEPRLNGWTIGQYIYGLAALHSGDAENAAPRLEVLAPVNVQAVYYSGLAHLLAGRSVVGWQFLHAAVELEPRHLQARYYRALAAIKAEQAEKAADDMKATVSLSPRQILPYAAYAMRAARRSSEALAMLDELEKLAPDDPWPRLQKALVLGESMQYDAALTILRGLPASCIERMLIAGFITFYRSLELGQKGDAGSNLQLEMSQKAVRSYLARRPTDVVAWTRLAMSASALGDCTTMVEAATQILDHAIAEELSLRILALQLRAGGHAGLGAEDAAQYDRMEAASLIVQLPTDETMPPF
ncbi:MAG: tetratricopeptide repeat protein [Candidatus Xenobia bacterium]